MAQDRYSEATWENGQLEIHLGASQAALLAIEEETNAVRARLAESDAMVAGKMDSKNTFTLICIVFTLIALLFSMIASPDGAVGVPPTGGERGHGCR